MKRSEKERGEIRWSLLWSFLGGWRRSMLSKASCTPTLTTQEKSGAKSGYNFLKGLTLALTGLAFQCAARSHQWHRQLHIFEVPFYYVEYAIAEMGALQVYRNYLRKGQEAVDDYLAALAMGGIEKTVCSF